MRVARNMLRNNVLLVLAGLLPAWSHAQEWPYQTYKSSDFTPPVLDVWKSGDELGEGTLFFGVLGEVQGILPRTGPVAMSDDGELVWAGPHGYVNNFKVQTLHNKPVLTYWKSDLVTTGHGTGKIYILDTNYTLIHVVNPDIPLRNETGWTSEYGVLDIHESQITSRNTMLATVYNVTRADLSSVGGPRRGWVYDCLLLEMDIATSEVLFRWSALEQGPKILDSRYPLTTQNITFGSYQFLPYDFFHMNSISLLENGDYLTNSRHMWTAYQISHKTGEIVWEFNGETGGDFSGLTEEGKFTWQHHTRTVNETETSMVMHLFNNHNALVENGPTNGLLFHMDLENKTSTLLKVYNDTSDPLYAQSQGSYDALPNDNVFMGYGQVPVIKEFGPDGNVRMSIVFGNETFSYRAYRSPWEATPSGYGPSLVASTSQSTGWVSWNGDTRTTHWRVLYSDNALNGSLQFSGYVPKTGFETNFTIPSNASYVKVEAYQKFKLLGSSEVVAVGL